MWQLLAILTVFYVLGTAYNFFGNGMPGDPEVNMNISQIIAYWGYPNEEYEVVTEDGSILSLNRIPHGKNSSRKGPRPITYLQHGLLTSAADWVLNLPNDGLAFMLADAGYDVWMGNSRGNIWSRKHIYFSPDSSEFWAFSFDEMAKYDLPATINFILKMTGYEQLYYVGYSQGSTIAFIAFSTDQVLAQKIKAPFALSPIATVKYMKSPLNIASWFPKKMFKILFGEKAFYTNALWEKFLATQICILKVLDRMCVNAIFFICGDNLKNLNMSRLDVYLSHRAGWQNGQFQAYDWGSPVQNMIHFNQTTPPFYRVEDMRVPTFLWSGGNDWVASKKDVENLHHQLPNLIYHKKIPSYNHLDFIWGIDTSQQICNEMIEMMKQNISSLPVIRRN